MSEIMSKVQEVNRLLEQGEPGNISVDSYSGYTGYKPMAVVDAMNSTFGIGQWGFEEEISEVESEAKLVVSRVRVWLAGVESRPTAWGQARITKGDIGDGRKSSQTDSIKKALSYFSIGNRAYLGLLNEEQAKPARPVERAHPAPQSASRPAPRTDEPASENVQGAMGNIKQRLNTIFVEGKRRGLFTDKPGMADYVSRCLVCTVEPQDLVKCSPEDLHHVAKLIASEQEPEPATA